MRSVSLYRIAENCEAAEWPGELLPPEVAFLSEADVPRKALQWAALCAREQGVGAEEALIAEGLIEESAYYRALASRLNCPFIERAMVLAPGFDYRAALRASVARADPNAEKFDWLMAPRGKQVVNLLRLADTPGAWGRIAVCAPKFFSALVRAKGRRALSEDASFALPRADARLSASAPQVRRSNFFAIALILAVLAGMFASEPRLFAVSSLLLSLLFFGGIYVRSCAIAAHLLRAPPPPRRLSERALPTYTIIAPMYREASVAAQFVAALKALDYPAAKLDVKLVLEADDFETSAALRAAGLAPNMEIVVAPPGAPKTKPRALNVALPLARGRLLTIFDAEDRPEPDQLRVAAEAYAAAGPRVACLQARLAVDNGGDGFFAYFFAISYAALFDVVNPGLGRLGMPMPLGGTSNHFRTDLLRRVAGWDAWNVTEDADIGLRLARFGYRVETIDSATYEDAPINFSDWLGQRTRWMKGWMQTLAVFLRTPRRNIRKMGLFEAFSALCAMTSLIAGPLFGPFYVVRLIRDLWFGDLLAPQDPERLILDSFSLGIVLFGALVFVTPNLIGMRRRNLSASPVLLLAPVYLLALSFAAWRALWEWTRQPFVWTKTSHLPRQRFRPIPDPIRGRRP
ncbi:glycosyltransferase family 2 protein [uncultured Rhodoblastus sp.]|uniref:glycosyltransferase family 2 protein n=1 Tax=uncultured Rhodoblastus sp. TaxID=543037 RepID=UPI0025EC8185|nr:glycosyltransferase family 2 protein [uncultured Rhodoblastus sp.]